MEGASKRGSRQLADGTDGSEFWRSEWGAKESGEAGETELLDVLGGRGCVYVKLHHAQKRLEGHAWHFYRGWVQVRGYPGFLGLSFLLCFSMFSRYFHCAHNSFIFKK